MPRAVALLVLGVRHPACHLCPDARARSSMSCRSSEAHPMRSAAACEPCRTARRSWPTCDSASSSPLQHRCRCVKSIGLPDWADNERYDVTAKPPAGSHAASSAREMWRTFFAERMKLVAHVEERERDTFALVARAQRRTSRPAVETINARLQPADHRAHRLPPPPPQPTSDSDYLNRCGGRFGNGIIVSGGTTMERWSCHSPAWPDVRCSIAPG